MSSESIKVLLVEDNLGDARLLYEGMEEAFPQQFQMTHVRRLSEALEALWEESINVVLLDLGLPDSHGLDTLILTRAQSPDVPIVVLSGFEDSTLVGQALREGAQDYLFKGQVDSNLLARSMRYAIARKAAEKAMVQRGILIDREDALERSQQHIIAVHERVCQNVAIQLHDGLHQKLLILMGCLQEIQAGLGSLPDTARDLGEVIDEMNLVIERQLAALTRQLHPVSYGSGLIPTFQSFGDLFGLTQTVKIDLDDDLVRQVQANPNLVPEPIALAVYRIAEEALTNVVKHANASTVNVRLDSPQEGWLRLTVQDDGQGFDMKNAHLGLGIATMHDYAGAMGGECMMQSDPGMGTEVTVLLPLTQPDVAQVDTSGQGDH